MVREDASHNLLAQLSSLCSDHPVAPKYVLVPRSQIGQALENAMAHTEKAWGGISGVIPRHLAKRVARPKIVASGRTELPVEGLSFLTAEVLQEVEDVSVVEGLPGPHHVASAVAEAITSLRLAGVDPTAVQKKAQSETTSETFSATAICYERYLELLDEKALYDDADVFRWAAERVRTAFVPEVRQAVIAVCDGTDLPNVAHRFVKALQSECRAFTRLGAAEPTDAPEQTAAALFGNEPPPKANRKEERPSANSQCRRVVGAFGEVRAALRDALNRGVPLDEVEIAYGGTRPYLSLIADQAERGELPVSISTGLPAAKTRTGQAVRAFLQWITEGFNVSVLTRMLRSGLLRTDRFRPTSKPLQQLRQRLDLDLSAFDGLDIDISDVRLEAHEAATLLAARRYEPGRAGYYKALLGAIQRREERIEELNDRGAIPRRKRREQKRLLWLLHLIDELFQLIPRSGSVREMAAGARRFIETFGPVDPPPQEQSEEERTLEEAARVVLWQRLDRLSDVPTDFEARDTQMAALFRRWVDGQFVRAQHPRSGTAHVVPLESAGYGGRSYLCVVGMDSETLSTGAAEGAMIHDSDRQVLSTSLGGVLPERRPQDEALWRQDRALRRHTGAVSLYTRTFDTESGEERYPSSLFLEVEASSGSLDETGNGAPEMAESNVQGILPPMEGLLCDDMEAWLRSYRAQRDGLNGTSTTAREELRATHPWIRHGEVARAHRQSSEYTPHDGLLPEDEYPELDFFGDEYEGGPLSAGRLETFAESPYIYFLKYVLGVRPIDEPALDDDPWLNRLRRGTILHDTFEAFMKAVEEELCADHEDLLCEILKEQLGEECDKVAPPSNVVKEAAHRQLLQDALVFFRSEVERAGECEPEEHEIGFGFGPTRQKEGDLGRAHLTIGGRELPLRGRIDRVDRLLDGDIAIWDYKTGSSSSYGEEEPLRKGAQMQWALYAYAYEALTDETVRQSGYFFTSAKEMGTRLTFSPDRYRDDVERYVEALGRLARNGCFPMTPDAKNVSAWDWSGYDRIVSSLRERCDELSAKAYPDARPQPLCFED